MKSRTIFHSAIGIAAISFLSLSLAKTDSKTGAPKDANWPAFRGANAEGIAEGAPTPSKWSPANVKWRTAIPGLGHCSPIIWGNKIFLTTSISGAAKNDLKVGLYGDVAP